MENILTAFRNGLGNYANFQGRASRPEYWWWILLIFLLFIVLGLIDAFVVAPMLGFGPGEDSGRPLSLLVSLGLFLPNLALGIRRLHDTNRSGWWILIGLIPLIGVLVLLYFYTRPSDEGENDHGPQPKWPPTSA
ncbi:MAG: DUF805 domain-containing protein [Rhodobacteraceae bacterium]|nr:DUF805 domain-containing protein [Paracoccaceae bacterium]